MSRYLILFLLNLPFALAGMVSAVTQYKLNRTPRRKLIVQLIFWLLVIIALALAEPIYQWLFSNNLTQTEPLSLFDVVLFTGLVITFYLANRTRVHQEQLERRVKDLHQQLSIALSDDAKKN